MKQYQHDSVMFAQGSFAQNVLKRDGPVSRSVVDLQRKLFGFAAKIVCLPSICVNFPKKTLYNLLEKDCLFVEFGFLFLSASIVLDTFPAYFSMITKTMFPYVKKNGAEVEKWSKMMEICNTPDLYYEAVMETFSDEIYNFGRIYVLTIFTESLCRKYPEFQDEIKNIYLTFLTQIK